MFREAVKRYWPQGLFTICVLAAMVMFIDSVTEAASETATSGNAGSAFNAWGTTYQFLLIGVIGGGLTYFYRLNEKRRDQVNERREFLRSYYAELVHAYNETKRIRRSLRAKSKVEGGKLIIRRGRFEELLLQLECAQLELEHLCRKIGVNARMFNDGKPANGVSDIRSERVREDIEKAESYVRKVLRAFEDGDHVDDCADDVIHIPQDSPLYEFIVRSRDVKAQGIELKRDVCLNEPLQRVETEILTALKEVRDEPKNGANHVSGVGDATFADRLTAQTVR